MEPLKMNAQWDLECRSLSMTELRRIVICNLWDSVVENSVTLFKKLIHLPQIQADLRQMNYTNGELMIGIVEFICSNLRQLRQWWIHGVPATLHDRATCCTASQTSTSMLHPITGDWRSLSFKHISQKMLKGRYCIAPNVQTQTLWQPRSKCWTSRTWSATLPYTLA